MVLAIMKGFPRGIFSFSPAHSTAAEHKLINYGGSFENNILKQDKKQFLLTPPPSSRGKDVVREIISFRMDFVLIRFGLYSIKLKHSCREG